ncbi:MAG: carboxypeptidase regulatory-like domain-containing protein [Acidobacteria bacterium]|nr:carboxypeptidase regulatory-like domain-containing protein [Acidobacteriota bacterium]
MFGFIGKHIGLNLNFRVLFYIAAALLPLALVTGYVRANNIRWYISPSDPYIQTWSDTTAITVDDDWSNFIAINGYRGDDLTTGVGVDPQTVLADGESTPLMVIANQANPNNLAAAGVAEFDGLANPTVALKGSATADAPHLLIQLNKESCPDTKFITVSYNVRDLDSTRTDALQQVALQFRVGTTGNFTNVPGAFVYDATEGSRATRVTPVFGTLPHIPVSDNIIYLRILTTNAAGGINEWVGIDDITIGCYAPTASNVTVSGRVTGGGRATVLMTDQEGNSRSVKTNSFGLYRFDDVPAGQTYTLNAYSKGSQYDPKVVTVADSVTDLDFYPQP